VKKIREDWALYLLVGMICFFSRDLFGFRMNNFEKMVEKFVQKEVYTEAMQRVQTRLEKIDGKIDELLRRGK